MHVNHVQKLQGALAEIMQILGKNQRLAITNPLPSNDLRGRNVTQCFVKVLTYKFC